MGLPCTGVSAMYRNPQSEVIRFLNTYHEHHFKIYNLCTRPQDQYDPEKFGLSVVSRHTIGHHCPQQHNCAACMHKCMCMCMCMYVHMHQPFPPLEARPYSELPRAPPQASFPSERTTGRHPNPNPKTNPIPLTRNAQASFPFEDHGVPPLEMLDALARSVQACAHTVRR